MELIGYTNPIIESRTRKEFDSLLYRSDGFQRSFLEFIYTNYPKVFSKEIKKFILQAEVSKIFAMSAEYLLQNDGEKRSESTRLFLKTILNKNLKGSDDPIIQSLLNRLDQKIYPPGSRILPVLFSNKFLPGNVVVYSIQRKNRNYPGIVIVRKRDGSFVTQNGKIFGVTQLARSITNLPYYLTNGNTPQGIFRMYGFDVSKSTFIGPTINIQLTMPAETSLEHFMKDSTINDSAWTEEWYKKLLPGNLKNYFPLYESYYAGKAGRTEIISHGTTVDPEYYKGKSYYPYTPTQGCLCTKELWSGTNGSRIFSDQQKLIGTIELAGGPDGYLVVIELDNKQSPVTINEILPFLTKQKR
jgi:hypothetical protein